MSLPQRACRVLCIACCLWATRVVRAAPLPCPCAHNLLRAPPHHHPHPTGQLLLLFAETTTQTLTTPLHLLPESESAVAACPRSQLLPSPATATCRCFAAASGCPGRANCTVQAFFYCLQLRGTKLPGPLHAARACPPLLSLLPSSGGSLLRAFPPADTSDRPPMSMRLLHHPLNSEPAASCFWLSNPVLMGQGLQRHGFVWLCPGRQALRAQPPPHIASRRQGNAHIGRHYSSLTDLAPAEYASTMPATLLSLSAPAQRAQPALPHLPALSPAR